MIKLEKSYSNILSNYKFIDLFAGIGGFRLSLESYGANCVFSSEIDNHAQYVYELNYNSIPDGDITKINEEEIPSHDIICGGFPCQSFSISGKQLGFNDTRGTLFFDVARIVEYHKPKLVFLENVKNFATHDNGNTLNTIKETLENLGYDFFYEVLNASDFGVPQSRKRIYMLAFRKDLNVKNFIFPKSNNIKIKLDDVLEKNKDINLENYIINRTDIKLTDDLKILKDKNGDYPKKPIRIGTISKGGQGERIYHTFGHAITLSANGGGVAGKTGGYLVDGKLRRLTEKEVARVSGFPDTFKFTSKGQTYKQFGNTVVVNVLQEILKKVIDEKIL